MGGRPGGRHLQQQPRAAAAQICPDPPRRASQSLPIMAMFSSSSCPLEWILNFYLTFLVVSARSKYKLQHQVPHVRRCTHHLITFTRSRSQGRTRFQLNRQHAARSPEHAPESWGPVMILMLVQYCIGHPGTPPRGILWLCMGGSGRFIYGLGYASKGPEGRLIDSHWLPRCHVRRPIAL